MLKSTCCLLDTIVCECARVSLGELKNIISKHNIKTFQELKIYSNAGIFCKSCIKPGGLEKMKIYLFEILNDSNKENFEIQ